jgi:hypothetical protein
LRHLRRLVGGHVRHADVERAIPLPNDDDEAQDASANEKGLPQQPFVSSKSTGRRRALLIGITYRGELLNTHRDVDRYRDVLIGTISIVFLAATISSLIIITLNLYLGSLEKPPTGIAPRISPWSRTTPPSPTTSSRPARTSSVVFL